MTYLAQLKAKFSEKALPTELTKPTKAPSVSFVGATSRHISEFGAAPVNPAKAKSASDIAANDSNQPAGEDIEELKALVALAITDLEDFPLALGIALADPVNGLRCFREHCRQYGLNPGAAPRSRKKAAH